MEDALRQSNAQPQKIAVGSASIPAIRASTSDDGSTRSYSWNLELRSHQNSDHSLRYFV